MLIPATFFIMPEKRKKEEPGIKWRDSAAKDMLLADLAAETLPIDEDVCSAEEAWSYYKELIEFKNVPFSQFEKQLKKHREQMSAKFVRSIEQWNAFQRLREQRPEPTTYDNGRRIFRHSAAYKLLRDDVYNKRHHSMTPSAFRLTCPEYQEWGLTEFSQRIFQMERQWKFINYLEKKREDEKIKKEVARLQMATLAIKEDIRKKAKK